MRGSTYGTFHPWTWREAFDFAFVAVQKYKIRLFVFKDGDWGWSYGLAENHRRPE